LAITWIEVILGGASASQWAVRAFRIVRLNRYRNMTNDNKDFEKRLNLKVMASTEESIVLSSLTAMSDIK
jgi:hypothetical protein